MVDEIPTERLPITPVTRIVVISLLRSWIREQEKNLSLVSRTPELIPWIGERERVLDIVKKDLAVIELT
jgi:hypothetical protein